MGYKRATLLLLLILQSLFVTFSYLGVVEANGTIYIRADGSVQGTDKISRNGNRYSFTGDIYGSIVVEKDNIVVDGMGYSIDGTNIGLVQSLEGIGIRVENRSEVTITNVTVQHFQYGIYINRSSNNLLTETNIKNNIKGVVIEHSSQTIIRKSQITNNLDVGIYALESPDTIFQNSEIAYNGDGILFVASINFDEHHNYFNVHECNIRANSVGIQIVNSLNSSIISLVIGGNITSNDVGAYIEGSFVCIQFNNIENNNVGIQLAGSGNEIDHNNFINNTKQVYDLAWDNPEMPPSLNSWYEGDTGNYWSDYTNRYPNATENYNIGAWNMPYVLDNNNQDNFPTINWFTIPNQWNPPEDFRISNMFWSVIIITILAVTISLYIYYVLKKKRQKN